MSMYISKNYKACNFIQFSEMVSGESSRAKIILEVIGVTILAFILSLFFGFLLIVPLDILGYDPESVISILGSTILGQMTFLILAYLYVRRRRILTPITFPSKSDFKYIVWGTLLALSLAVGLQILLGMFGLLPESPLEEIAAANPNILLALAFLSVVLVAPAEELLFRGAIQGRLRERYSYLPAIITASILFGAMHLGNYVGELIPVLLASSVIVIVSTVLGFVYEKTKNLVVPISVHAIYNVILLLMSYFAM